jgi:putative ABC transport system substrate-binding protein
MRRREFIAALGAAATWPLAVDAQEHKPVRRIGVFMPLAADDPQSQHRLSAFVQALQQLGWSEGRNVHIEPRWGAANVDRIRRHAAELVALAPDVIVADGSSIVDAVRQATRTVPIVFVNVTDPVGGGFVESLSRPGGNVTGFTLFEYALGVKWLELLKEIVPAVTRVGVFRNPVLASGGGQLGAIQAAAPSLGVELRPLGVRDPSEIERSVSAFARAANGGLIVTASISADQHRDLIVGLAARHRLAAVYPFGYWATNGGLVAYGPDLVDPYRRAAGYVDRILRGEKPADLPAQAPTRYTLTVNLKTAKALGIEIPPTLLARADEVIE